MYKHYAARALSAPVLRTATRTRGGMKVWAGGKTRMSRGVRPGKRVWGDGSVPSRILVTGWAILVLKGAVGVAVFAVVVV